jgi:hypothetical protein
VSNNKPDLAADRTVRDPRRVHAVQTSHRGAQDTFWKHFRLSLDVTAVTA